MALSIASRPYGQVRLSFAAISIASIEACLILAKSLLCCNFHSLEACLAACLLLAKSLFCSTFHSINGNFYSLEACLPRGLPHPSQASVLLHFPSHPWQSSRPASRPASAKCLFCSTFHRIHGNPRGLPRGLEACLILAKCLFAPLSIASMAISIASRPASRACLILAKCLFCCSFHSILWQFPYPQACLEACLILAKCLCCCNFHRAAGNFHSPKACLEACLGADCLHVSKECKYVSMSGLLFLHCKEK